MLESVQTFVTKQMQQMQGEVSSQCERRQDRCLQKTRHTENRQGLVQGAVQTREM